ncbi:DUF4349 domain-containing protein [Umezawaea sp. Da 62-37]|uniref:DUF4349 domain-containing protein n=1 Tax=Umezawaea sp. Da 62-37 TaxID=3075927 RepID=UPI0028F716A7|nr:DUF4349 domain-containing protein [Umezawaea sp. Da 62-37]WNV91071.1 DUF4349 domain-containing protein [Umezawaea sp. Da 62-37]
MGRRTLVVTALAVMALAGCSGADNSSAGGSADMPARAVAPAPAQGNSTPGAKEAAPDQAQSQPAGTAAADRQMVRTADVSLRGEDVEAVLAKVKELAQRENGFVSLENSSSSTGSVTLRVPADRMDVLLKGIGEIDGTTLVSRSVKSEDVTEQVVDVESRLATQRASVDRVRALLDRAATTSEITDIEGELTRRQSELESLQRRHDSLKGQVALSTISVTIRKESAAAQAEEEMGFLGALASGWSALVKAFRVIVVVIGAVLPFAVVLGLLFAVFWTLRKRRRPVTGGGAAVQAAGDVEQAER